MDTSNGGSAIPKTCKRGHVLSDDNLVSNGKAGLICRACKNMRSKTYYDEDPEQSRAAGRARMRKHLGPVKGNANARKDCCPQGHPYDEENTYIAPNGGRQCKICRKVRVVESWWRHREKRIAENKAWRLANPEKVRENIRKWVEANPERSNMLHRLKKQRRRAAGVLTADEWELVLAIYGNACLACGKDEVTIDHVIPVSKGGLNVVGNVQPLCSYCNTSKGTKTIDYRPMPWDDLAA